MDDAGVGLAELLVTMVVMSMVLLAVTTLVVSTHKVSNRTQLLDGNTQQLRIALDQATKTLRAAHQPDPLTPAFLLSTHGTVSGKSVVQNGRECWFLSNVGPSGTPQLVRYYVDATTKQFIEQTTAPDATSTAPNFTYTGAPLRTRVLANGVSLPSDGAVPIFTYYPGAADPTTSVPYNGPTSTTTGSNTVSYAIPDSLLNSISDVRVTLVVTAAGPTGSSTTMTNRIRLVNADVAAVNAP